MYQETRETTQAIIEDEQREIDAIISANKHRKEPYWIVMYAKPSKNCVDGKPTLVRYIKPHSQRPNPQVGMRTCKVDNQAGTFEWDINMPQIPFDFDALLGEGADEKRTDIVESTSIPNAYVTKKAVA